MGSYTSRSIKTASKSSKVVVNISCTDNISIKNSYIYSSGTYKEKKMYRLYGKNKNYEYELIKIVQEYEEAEQIVFNDNKYINILVIKREHNADEVISIEKPKVKIKNFK